MSLFHFPRQNLKEIYEKSPIIFIIGLIMVSFIAGLKTEAYLAEKNFRYEKYTVIDDTKPATICGSYDIEGTNPLGSDSSYKGKLTLSLEKDIIKAKWKLDDMKVSHYGIGLLKNDILSISFHLDYSKKDKSIGIVQYKFKTPTLIEGFWTTMDSSIVGIEKGRKIN